MNTGWRATYMKLEQIEALLKAQGRGPSNLLFASVLTTLRTSTVADMPRLSGYLARSSLNARNAWRRRCPGRSLSWHPVFARSQPAVVELPARLRLGFNPHTTRPSRSRADSCR